MNTVNLILRFMPKFIRKKIEGRKELIKILDNINWLTGEKLLRLSISIFVSALVARYLGPEQFGMMSFAVAFVSLFSPLFKLGLDGIVVRELVNNPRRKNELLGSAFFMKIMGSFVMLILAFGTILFFKPDNGLMQLFTFIILIGYIFQSFEVIDFYFQSKVKSKYTVIARIVSFLIISILKVCFVFFAMPLVAFVLIFALDLIIVSIGLISFYGIRNIFNWRAKISIMRELLKDSWPLILSALAVLIYMRIDQIMIGSILGDVDVGIYSVAVRISEIWYFIPVVIANSVFPSILKVRNNKKLYYERIQKLFDYSVWFSIVIAICVTFISKPLINILYGQAYIESASVLSVHIWATIFVFLGLTSGKVLLGENLNRISFYRTFISAILNIILNFLLIPIFGIIGAAYATLISYALAAHCIIFIKPTRNLGVMMLKSFNLFRIMRFCL